MSETVQLGEIGVDGAELASVCQRYHVRELAVFGSAARNAMTVDSDIDVMVEFLPGARIGIVKFGMLAQELEAMFGHPVDLVTKRGLKPWIRPHAMRDARLLYAA